MQALCRAFDWSRTSLGSTSRWPQSLRTAAQLVLDTPFPTIVLWGAELIQIYNDGYRRLMGNKHPLGLGQPTRYCWPEVWAINQPLYERVWAGESVSFTDACYPITRSGQLEEAWFTLSYSPVREESGQVGGILVTVFETTDRVQEQRQRQQAQQALRQSEYRFSMLIRATSHIVYTMNADWQLMLHLDGGDYLVNTTTPNENWLKHYIPTYEQERVRSAIQQAITRNTFVEAEHQVIRQDGSLGWVFSRAIPIRNEEGQIQQWLGAASDITDRKRAEEALRDSEQKYRTLFTSIDEGYCIIEMLYDAAGKPVDWIYLEANPTFERQTGWWAPGKTVSELVGPVEEFWLDFYHRVLITGQAERTENKVAALNRWYTIYASRDGGPGSRRLVVIFDDVTERKQMQERQAFILTLSDALRPLSDSAIIEETACRLLGEYLVADRVYCPVINLTEKCVVVEQEYIRDHSPSLRGTYPLSSSGIWPALLGYKRPLIVDDITQWDISREERIALESVQHVSLLAIPFLNKGVLVGTLTVVDKVPRHWKSGDVDLVSETLARTRAAVERAQTEEALRRSEEQLRIADRRKDDFLAMLAHELRNPMATLHNTLLVLNLTRGQDESLPLEKAVSIMSREVTHLNRMVDDLLDLSRISLGKIQLKMSRVNLVELVKQATQSIRPQFDQQEKTLHVAIHTPSIELSGDATRLIQVINNLLTNGIRYTTQQGEVWLSLVHRHTEAILQVRDNGIGLAPDQLSTIFELFVQVDTSSARSKGGLGLGLTLVKQIVQMHGGRVDAQSEGLGKGSTFTVYLPTLTTASEQAPKSDQSASAPPVSDRILIIDDNAELRSHYRCCSN